jgi:hypothetical protein
MELPDDVLMYLKEFTRPISRPDWRKGCALNRGEYDDIFINYIEYTFYRMVNPLNLEANGYDEGHYIHKWDDFIPAGIEDDDDDDDDE